MSVDHDIIIVGAGFAALFTAQILSEVFPTRTILIIDKRHQEQDEQVAQATFPHNLTSSTWETLFDMFPGLREEVVDAGSEIFSWKGKHVRMRVSRGYIRPPRLKNMGYSISRPELEPLIRAHVARLQNVKFLNGRHVVGLTGADDGQITGVKVLAKAKGQNKKIVIFHAPLVVIAAGANVHLDSWLRKLGYPSSKTTEVNGKVDYVCQKYEHPAEDRDESSVWIVDRSIPDGAWIGAGKLNIEDNYYYVFMHGIGGNNPSKKEDFDNYLQRLIDPHLYDYIKRSKVVPDSWSCWKARSRLHEYHRQATVPGGLIVIGDALISTNPFFGLGIDSAMKMALALKKYMQKHPGQLSPAQTKQLLKQLVHAGLQSWFMAIADDIVYDTNYDGTAIQAIFKVGSAYKAMIFNAMATSSFVTDHFLSVVQGDSLLKLGNPLFVFLVLYNQYAVEDNN